MEKNQNLPIEMVEIISKVMKYIEKTESDFIAAKTAPIEEEKYENS